MYKDILLKSRLSWMTSFSSHGGEKTRASASSIASDGRGNVFNIFLAVRVHISFRRAVEGDPFRIVLRGEARSENKQQSSIPPAPAYFEKAQHLDCVFIVEGEAVVYPCWKHEQVIRFDEESDPLVRL